MLGSLSTYTFKWQQTSLVFKAIMGALLIFFSAQISIPLDPVPITLQSFAVSLIALTHTPRQTLASIGLYLVAGLVGLPVFAHFTGGPAVFLSGRGGFLIGFLVAGGVTSWIASQTFKPLALRLSAALMAGLVSLYACGIVGLLPFFSFEQAINVGLLPFIMPGLVKSALLVGALSYLKKV